MVEFDLSDAHPGFRRLISAIVLPLVERYPGAKLFSVGLRDPKPGDTSMASTSSDGKIDLNPYWFGRDPRLLRAAARRRAECGWHGPMTDEPEHVLTHEFGHIVWLAVPHAAEWVLTRWRAATRDTRLAPSGYALAGDPREFFAEFFALVELGHATDEEETDLRDLVDGLRQVGN